MILPLLLGGGLLLLTAPTTEIFAVSAPTATATIAILGGFMLLRQLSRLEESV